METIENLILKLNEILEGGRFYRKRFDKLLNEFKEMENPEIVLIDFEYFNEERLSMFRESKIKCIARQDFETAAKCRKMENRCHEYIAIKEEYSISRTMVFYEKEYLFYFYFGTTKLEKKIREFIKPFINKQ
jgi:hypothetical protein